MPVITVLNDNHATGTPGLVAEHGLSYLVDAGEPLLFDTGPSDVLIRNANTLGLDLGKVRTIVLSHGHWDHGNGLQYLHEGEYPRKLICHPRVFEKKYRKEDHSYIGLPFSRETAIRHFNLVESETPVAVNEKVIFLGAIPRINDFEAKTTAFELEDGSEDFVLDDSGIAIRTSQGIIVITGCGHAGICNTVKYAATVTGDDRIVAVLGGFHLKRDDEITGKVIACLKQTGVGRVYPSHCTAPPALGRFYDTFGENKVSVGDVLVFDE